MTLLDMFYLLPFNSSRPYHVCKTLNLFEIFEKWPFGSFWPLFGPFWYNSPTQKRRFFSKHLLTTYPDTLMICKGECVVPKLFTDMIQITLLCFKCHNYPNDEFSFKKQSFRPFYAVYGLKSSNSMSRKSSVVN